MSLAALMMALTASVSLFREQLRVATSASVETKPSRRSILLEQECFSIDLRMKARPPGMVHLIEDAQFATQLHFLVGRIRELSALRFVVVVVR